MSDEERTPEELRWQHIQERFEELRGLLSEEKDGYVYMLFVHHLKSRLAISSVCGNGLQIAELINWLSKEFGTAFKMGLVIELSEQIRKERAEVLFKVMLDSKVTH